MRAEDPRQQAPRVYDVLLGLEIFLQLTYRDAEATAGVARLTWMCQSLTKGADFLSQRDNYRDCCNSEPKCEVGATSEVSNPPAENLVV